MGDVIDIKELLLRRRNLRAAQSPAGWAIRQEAWLERMKLGPPRPPVSQKTLGGPWPGSPPGRKRYFENEENDDV